MQLTGERLSYVAEPNTELDEYVTLANRALAIATQAGAGPGKYTSISVINKSRRDPNPQPKYHELVVSILPPAYYYRGLMWLGSLINDAHYRVFHVCLSDPPNEAQWVMIPTSSWVYDPLGYIDSVESSGVVAGGAASSSQSGLVVSEDLSAGDFVNVWGPSFQVRRATASDPQREASGYVKSNYTMGSIATVYFGGINNVVAGLSPGPVFLSTTPGGCSNSPPALAGQIVHRLGTASSSTAVNFSPETPVLLTVNLT